MAAVCLAHLASQPLPPTAYKQLSDFLLTMSRDEDTKEASGSARQPQRQVSRSAPSTSAAKSIARSKKGDSEMNSRSGGCSKVKLAVKSKRDGEEQSCASRAQSSQRSSFPLSAPSAGARREAKASSDGDDDEHDGLRRRLVGRAAGVTVSSDFSAFQITKPSADTSTLSLATRTSKLLNWPRMSPPTRSSRAQLKAAQAGRR